VEHKYVYSLEGRKMAGIKTRILQIILILLFILLFCPFSNGKVIYVDYDAVGANEGTSWTNAYIYLQEALSDANSSEKPIEIRVAQGTYRPNEGLVAIPEFDWRTTTFQLINGVTIKGGYAGTDSPDPNAYDFALYETILSGDLNGDDAEVTDPCDLIDEPTRAENSYHVLTGSGTDETSVLDGFTISGGNANESSNQFGGGIHNIDSGSTITNCIFSENYATKMGGCIYNQHSSLIITNCIFENNLAGNLEGRGGGGMLNEDSSITMIDCAFSNNSTLYKGGAMQNENCILVFINCVFSDNSAKYNGGAMTNGNSTLSLINCTFKNNMGGEDFGGGMYNRNCHLSFDNCTFYGNTVNGPSAGGGGICNIAETNAVLNTCTFTSNSAAEGSAISNYSSNLVMTNCILWSNEPNEIFSSDIIDVTYSNISGGWEGEGNIDVDPLFADPNNGDYHLKSEMGRWDPNSESWIKDDVTSPCIDAGDPNSDFSGETWTHGGRINMGAYGGTRQASMSLETGGLLLSQVAYIYSHRDEEEEDFESLLKTYGCSTTLIKLKDVAATSLDSYDLIILSHDIQHDQNLSDPNTIAAIQDSGKPIVGLGDGGYDFFGLLGLSIGNPYGGHGSRNSIEVVDPNSSLFSTPYSIDIPADNTLQLYTETNHIGIYLWPTIPETVTGIGREVNDAGYYPLVTEHNRYLLWGFTESPQKMTEVGKILFINVVIWTANKAWESED